jgi:uncharacterized protein with von Willebrand factor type A (vWA) domain
VITRFPGRARGPAERVAGFIAHLRLSGIAAGPPETAGALAALTTIEPADPASVRLALRALCTGSADDWRRFDGLFDAYWLSRRPPRPAAARARSDPAPRLWAENRHGRSRDRAAAASDSDPDANANASGAAPLLASRRDSLTRRDLRELTDEAEWREAERVAARLAQAMRKRSRRRRPAPGAEIDLRRTFRRLPARGGEPIDLMHRRRRRPPLRLVALLDVSGSMSAYARVFLSFLKGLVGADARTRAYLFHTRLLQVTEALHDRDPLRAATRLSLMAEGFGGGTRIGHCIGVFNAGHARGVTRRTAVLILSDGYDTDPPAALAAELARLRRRAGRLVWLNPLGHCADAPPAAMATALPHLDACLPAATLRHLAALESEFARL